MDKYEVTIRDKDSGNHWTMMFSAENFANAEAQANMFINHKFDDLIKITKDYA